MKEFFYDWGGANTWLFCTLNAWHNDVSDTVMRLGTLLGDHERFTLYLVVLALIAWWRVERGDLAQRWLRVRFPRSTRFRTGSGQRSEVATAD